MTASLQAQPLQAQGSSPLVEDRDSIGREPRNPPSATTSLPQILKSGIPAPVKKLLKKVIAPNSRLFKSGILQGRRAASSSPGGDNVPNPINSSSVLIPRMQLSACPDDSTPRSFSCDSPHTTHLALELTKDTIVEYRLKNPSDGLCTLSLCWGTFARRNTCSVRIEILENGTTEALFCKTFSAYNISDNTFAEYSFPHITGRVERLVLRIQSPDASEGNTVALWTQQIPFAELGIQGQDPSSVEARSLALEKHLRETSSEITCILPQFEAQCCDPSLPYYSFQYEVPSKQIGKTTIPLKESLTWQFFAPADYLSILSVNVATEAKQGAIAIELSQRTDQEWVTVTSPQIACSEISKTGQALLVFDPIENSKGILFRCSVRISPDCPELEGKVHLKGLVRSVTDLAYLPVQWKLKAPTILIDRVKKLAPVFDCDDVNPKCIARFLPLYYVDQAAQGDVLGKRKSWAGRGHEREIQKLLPGKEVLTTFKASADQITRIGVCFGTHRRQNACTVQLTLFEGIHSSLPQNQQPLRETSINALTIVDNDMYQWELFGVSGCEGRSYTLAISSSDSVDHHCVSVWGAVVSKTTPPYINLLDSKTKAPDVFDSRGVVVLERIARQRRIQRLKQIIQNKSDVTLKIAFVSNQNAEGNSLRFVAATFAPFGAQTSIDYHSYLKTSSLELVKYEYDLVIFDSSLSAYNINQLSVELRAAIVPIAICNCSEEDAVAVVDSQVPQLKNSLEARNRSLLNETKCMKDLDMYWANGGVLHYDSKRARLELPLPFDTDSQALGLIHGPDSALLNLLKQFFGDFAHARQLPLGPRAVREMLPQPELRRYRAGLLKRYVAEGVDLMEAAIVVTDASYLWTGHQVADTLRGVVSKSTIIFWEGLPSIDNILSSADILFLCASADESSWEDLVRAAHLHYVPVIWVNTQATDANQEIASKLRVNLPHNALFGGYDHARRFKQMNRSFLATLERTPGATVPTYDLNTNVLSIPCAQEHSAAKMSEALARALATYRERRLPSFSIVSILYAKQREAPYFVEALARQSYGGDVEILLVDDCTPDNSVQIVTDTFAHFSLGERGVSLQILKNDENIGNCGSRNRAIAQARGDVVIVIDADCLVNRDFLQNHADAHAVGDADVVVGYLNLETNQLDPIVALEEFERKPWKVRAEAQLQDPLNKTSFLNCITRNFSIRRSFIQEPLFNELFSYSKKPNSGFGWEDVEMGYRLYKRGARVKFCENTFSVHVSHPPSVEEKTKPLRSLLNFRRLIDCHPEMLQVARRWVLDTYGKICSWADGYQLPKNEDRAVMDAYCAELTPELFSIKRNRPMRVLTYRWHVPHQFEIYKSQHQYHLLTGISGPGFTHEWAYGERPLRSNARFVSLDDVQNRFHEFDFAIVHFDENSLSPLNTNGVLEAEWGGSFRWFMESCPIPKVAICHGTPQFWGQYKPEYKGPDLGQPIKREIKRLVDYIADTLVICNSHQAQREWGFKRSRVIWQGFDPSEFPQTSYAKGLLALGERMQERPVYRGLEFYNEVMRDLPSEILPATVRRDFPLLDYRENTNAWAESCYQNYARFLAEYSIYFNPTLRSPMPRARGEAMMCGLVTVSRENHDVEMFITKGWNGFYSNNPEETRQFLLECVRHPSMVKEMGARSRALAMDVFNHDRFLAQWEEVISELVGA